MIALLRPFPSPLFSRRGLDMDFPLLAGCLALLGLGLVMIASASSEVAAVNSGNPLYHMTRHLIYLLIGLGAAGVVLLIPIATWQRVGGAERRRDEFEIVAPVVGFTQYALATD